MSSLCLPDSLTPLLMHVEPLLAAADKYQLGEQVSVDWSESGIVDIQIEERQFGLVYNQAEADIAGYKVLDQWMAPYPRAKRDTATSRRGPVLGCLRAAN